MKISIITPYYRGLKTIFKTIDSVFASAKNIEEINIEYIVIIDSMDDSDIAQEKIYNKYNNRIKIIVNEKNLGVAKSRNKALKVANFDYILFLDQDDTIENNYFENMKIGFSKNADIIVGNAYVVNAKNNKKVKMYTIKPDLSFNSFLKGNKILSPGQVMFSKKIKSLDNMYIGCSEKYKGADDWAAYLNIFTNYDDINVCYISEPIFNYVLHENNYSKNWKELNLSAVETAKFFECNVNNERKKILNKQIKFLLFENIFKDETYILKFRDIGRIVNYYMYDILNFNRVSHYINKKMIRFNN